jgi:hypothetical protein
LFADSPLSVKRFALDVVTLDAHFDRLKLLRCPHCGAQGMLIRHGFLRGYNERTSDRDTRGRRAFCSNRNRRTGCGRTFSVSFADVFPGFIVTALTLWKLLWTSLRTSLRAAMKRVEWPLSVRSGYRLRARFFNPLPRRLHAHSS